MGHDCIHDAGMTEPHCRTHGCVPKARQPGSGVQRKPLWVRHGRGSSPICTSRVAVTPDWSPLTSRSSYTHRLLQSVGYSGILLRSMMAVHILACHQRTMTRPCLLIPNTWTRKSPMSNIAATGYAMRRKSLLYWYPMPSNNMRTRAQQGVSGSKTCNSWHRPCRCNSTEGFGGLCDAPEIVSKRRWGFLTCLKMAEGYP